MKVFFTFFACLLACNLSVNGQIFTDSLSVPVRLSAMDGKVINNKNRITWRTACFLQYARFDIHRSYDGTNFTSIENFTADQLRCQDPFDFDDNSADRFAEKVFYRISVGDVNGRYYNSKVVTIFFKPYGWELHNISPSIVNTSTTLSISSSFSEMVTLIVSTVSGTVKLTKQINLSKGLNHIPIDASALQPGYFLVSIINSKLGKKTISFLKQ